MNSYRTNKEAARKIILEKVKKYAQIYGVTINRVSIRNQKSRWGSCSSIGNLNFNYRVAHLPEDSQNLVIVHEICHLLEFNHSDRFWKLVERTVPNYKQLTALLRKTSLKDL